MYRVGSQTRYSCGTLFKQTTTLSYAVYTKKNHKMH